MGNIILYIGVIRDLRSIVLHVLFMDVNKPERSDAAFHFNMYCG